MMDMRTSFNKGASSPLPSTQRNVRFNTQVRTSTPDFVDEMGSGFEFDMGTFDPLKSFHPKERGESHSNSIISFPEAAFAKGGNRTAASSLKAAPRDKHGVMAKCKSKSENGSHTTKLTSL